MNTSYLSEQVIQFVSDFDKGDLNVTLVHEDRLLGTAGTIEHNIEFFKDGPFICAHADNLTNLDIKAFINAHKKRQNSCVMTMVTFLTDEPRNCGIVELDENFVVQNFHEKVINPPGNLANGAIYIFHPQVIGEIKKLPKGPKDISRQIIPKFMGKIQSYLHAGYHRDIGHIDSLEIARREFTDVRYSFR